MTTFSRAPRTLLNDCNRSRFSRTCPSFENEPLSPGPAAYNPLTPGSKTTRQFILSRLDRGIRNRVDGKSLDAEFHRPGPATYAPNVPFTPHAPKTPPRDRAAPADEAPTAVIAARKEIDSGQLLPGPASYNNNPPPATTKRFQISKSPRDLGDTLNGERLTKLVDQPNPLSYDPKPPSPTTRATTFNRGERHLNMIGIQSVGLREYDHTLNPPGPGFYGGTYGVVRRPENARAGGFTIAQAPRKFHTTPGTINLTGQKKLSPMYAGQPFTTFVKAGRQSAPFY